MTHEPLKIGLFNAEYNGGCGTFAAWESAMLNTHDVVSLVVERMHKDYQNTAAKFRKAYAVKDIDASIKCKTLLFK